MKLVKGREGVELSLCILGHYIVIWEDKAKSNKNLPNLHKQAKMLLLKYTHTHIYIYICIYIYIYIYIYVFSRIFQKKRLDNESWFETVLNIKAKSSHGSYVYYIFIYTFQYSLRSIKDNSARQPIFILYMPTMISFNPYPLEGWFNSFFAKY